MPSRNLSWSVPALAAALAAAALPYARALIFKGIARALRDATEIDPRAANAIPSTKGSL